MFILKLAGKILLLPVWLILFVIGLAVKMTVQTYAVAKIGYIDLHIINHKRSLPFTHRIHKICHKQYPPSELEHTIVADRITSFFFRFMDVGFQIKIFLSLFGESKKFNVMFQAVTGNVHDVVALWIKQKFF